MNISTRHKYIFVLFAFVLTISAGSIFSGCGSATTDVNDPFPNVSDNDLTGEQLVSRYCTKCHSLTPINYLTSDVWHFHTLPGMAPLMGISTYGADYFKSDTAKGITLVNWQKIVEYYAKNAPLALQPQKRADSLINDMAGFEVKLPKGNGGIQTAYTTAVGIDSSTHKLFSGDAATLKFFSWDARLNASAVAATASPAVNMLFLKGAGSISKAVLSCIGQIEPMDYPNGRVVSVDADARNPTPKDIETDISRPVHTSVGDLDKDGRNDYVISAMGKLKGSLIWMKQNANGSFTRVVIETPRAPVQTIIGDYNNDGWPDIIALFGSCDEGISLYLNDHKGRFKERSLMKFPPVNGSTSFQLLDMNHDGKLDIVYSCGYNYRDSRILKPYHGVYIFTNQGDWKFKQSYFYPINGCTKAVAADFDGDGDIDIATSAFFADLKHQPGESCVYLEQDKAMHFKPHAIPVSKYGRWYSMAVGDHNGDGKPDIILGNYSRGLTIETNVNTGDNNAIPLIVLENHTKK